ncbi:MAG: hypothetical protein R3D29_09280 [Nitratireductor sp.]
MAGSIVIAGAARTPMGGFGVNSHRYPHPNWAVQPLLPHWLVQAQKLQMLTNC